MEFSYTCRECGNTERFKAAAREFHTWVVDGQGVFLEDFSLNDTELEEVEECVECGSTNVAWEEVKTPLGRLSEQLEAE